MSSSFLRFLKKSVLKLLDRTVYNCRMGSTSIREPYHETNLVTAFNFSFQKSHINISEGNNFLFILS